MDKVRNLLALAGSAGTEADRAHERAEALMFEHALDEAMLAEHGESTQFSGAPRAIAR